MNSLAQIPPSVPVLIAGWPGMGNVGIGAATYLRRKLGGQVCARLDVSRYCYPEAVEVRDGIGRIPALTSHDLYLVDDPPFFVFEGEIQVGGEYGVNIAHELLDFAVAHGTKSVYTGAAFAMPVSCREPVKVFGVATDERLKQTFPAYGVEPLVEGRISGLNGLLLGLAGARGIPAACFLATMPHYAVQTPNPKASRALVRVLERVLSTSVDMADIDTDIEESDRMLGEFETRVNEAISALRQQVERGAMSDGSEEHPPEPHEVMDRIERMFDAVQRDRSKAGLLKEELDRWGLFHLYEDRFLDLFDKNRKEE